ncbi:MAG: hypothetical protein FWE46_04980 [Coriobacteriia bacterium]|nr:hypothetical protein [Coriobacteriia bacterium]MCL2537628.1 hypothetical protein [Coriobacteriia bacterium]
MTLPQSKIQSYFHTRLIPFMVALVIAAAQALIANAVGIITGIFVWVLPAVTLLLLLLTVFLYPQHEDDYSKKARSMSIAVVAYQTIVNIVCMGWFVYDALNPHTITLATDLLGAGFALWIANVCIFALAYWELDGGGPEMRSSGAPSIFRSNTYPDFVFNQQTDGEPHLAPKDWQPGFIDYFYTSATTATAFAPASSTAYSATAKLLSSAESLVSFLTIGLIIAKAISL